MEHDFIGRHGPADDGQAGLHPLCNIKAAADVQGDLFKKKGLVHDIILELN